MFDRRRFLTGAAGIAAMAVPKISFAAPAPTNRRFIFLIQRGAADGLHILAPTGDTAFAAIRSSFMASLEGGAPLGGSFFTLHPALQRVGALYAAKQARFFHATASAYRDRSHFDGQNILETGATRPFAEKSGWMNRLVGQLPDSEARGMALASALPMAMRGPAQIATYAPSDQNAPSDDLMMRISSLYAQDPQLATLWKSALETEELTDGIRQNKRDATALGTLAAQLLLPDDGARVMMIESNGWDMHGAQVGRMNRQLKTLDLMIGALVDGLGPIWADTMLLVATEFGRTVAVNGTQGTDHGTGGLTMLLGGQLAGGGRIDADWPGLTMAALLDGRDLRPTMETEAIIAGALATHFGLDPGRLLPRLYPDQKSIKPLIV